MKTDPPDDGLSRFFKHMEEAEQWVCSCGERPSMNGLWRWNGRDWEHHHGYPIGHVTAKRETGA